MAEDEKESAVTQAELLYVTQQEYELFQREGVESIGKYNITDDDGVNRDIFILHLYPMFLGFKEAMQELVTKNGQLFQMLNTLNQVMLAMRVEIKNLNEEVAELKAKRIVH
jgi:hypothetical protein